MRCILLPAVLGLALVSVADGSLAAAEKGAAATILVRLPADAQLTLDNQPTTAKSALRQFITPPLAWGKTFYYTLKAKVTRGSAVMTVEEQVAVRAGEETVVTLEFPRTSRWMAPVAPAAAYGSAFTPASSYPAADWAWPGYARTYIPSYAYGAYTSGYFPSRSSSPGVTSLSDQDPLQGAGPPGTGYPLGALSGILQP